MSMISFDLLTHFHDKPSTPEGKEGKKKRREGQVKSIHQEIIKSLSFIPPVQSHRLSIQPSVLNV